MIVEANVLLDEGNYSLEKQELYGNGCRTCNNTFFPKRSFCPACLQAEHMEDFTIADTGTLYTYSMIHIAPAKFKPPYLVGYVDVSENLRLFGQIRLNETETININQLMRISIGEIGWDQQPLMGIVFTPEPEKGGN